MNHNARTGKGKTLPLGAGREDEGGHGCSETEVDGDDFTFDELHCVEDGKAGNYRSAGGVDVEVDGFGVVFFVEVEHDADDLVGKFVVDFGTQEDDTLSV